eukprot:2688321-Amphidinium_carterae.1
MNLSNSSSEIFSYFVCFFCCGALGHGHLKLAAPLPLEPRALNFCCCYLHGMCRRLVRIVFIAFCCDSIGDLSLGHGALCELPANAASLPSAL